MTTRNCRLVLLLFCLGGCGARAGRPPGASSGDGGASSGDGGSALDGGPTGSGGSGSGSGGGGSGSGSGGSSGGGSGGGGGGVSDVTFTIDAQAKRHAVSPYIYGINNYPGSPRFTGSTKFSLLRFGGNSYSAYNWENNDENSGTDLGCTTNYNSFMPGGGQTAGALLNGDSIALARQHGAASLVTLSLQDWVAADNTGCVTNAQYGKVGRFFANHAAKGATLCTCPPGGACPVGQCSIDPNDGNVYQDELVNFLAVNFPAGSDAGSKIFFALDNEPNWWPSKHPEVWSNANVTYDELVTRDSAFAGAVKAAWPAALVFGPVVDSPDGMVSAHSYNDAHKPEEFLDYYLAGMAKASQAAGHRLLDVLDVHFYDDDSSDPAECVQRPRDYWDPTYARMDRFSYIPNWHPYRLIPRLQDKIAAANPGLGLSVSEYALGCGDVPAGAVAQADALGVFGREGLFAAMLWTAQTYNTGAFAAYRSYDGKGAVVGDTSVGAVSSDGVRATVYALAHSDQAGALELVVINKQSSVTTAHISLANVAAFSSATLYRIESGAPTPKAAGTLPVGGNGLDYAMPGYSVTTIVLR